MAWSYRKSLNLGPFRLNVSKSGLGYSVGGRGFRVAVNPRGRQYTSVSIPGTGLRYYTSQKSTTGYGVFVIIAIAVVGLVLFTLLALTGN